MTSPESEDEFFENSIDAIPEPTIDDLLAAEVTTISYPVDRDMMVAAAMAATTPVADSHPDGHMFNKVRGVLFCACDCELCSAPAPLGKHYPQCICPECECDG